ncbi:MAG: T9SS C-terminal target domain-containing protein [Haliscomenobacteraceae bacterium CHB4]|nr:T9SS C-terminal target domain-containing protein [Haliscomenobacteraceae bacterium CHB4]
MIYTAFQLPNGVVADAPGNNATYTSPGGHSYDVRNPNFSPLYSVRFKEQGSNGIANGQMDIFEYTLPAQANPNYIHVVSRTGSSGYHEAYLNVFNCTVGTQTFDDLRGEDRQNASISLENNELHVFPNPTSGIMFADLSPWADEQVQIRAFNAQGQVVLNYTVKGLEMEQIEFPENLTNGLYFLEFSAANGEKQVKRMVLKR